MLKQRSYENNTGRYIRSPSPLCALSEPVGINEMASESTPRMSENILHKTCVSLRMPFASNPQKTMNSDEKICSPNFRKVRWIITKSALMEGWDCPFAYLLVMLDNTQAQRAITQLVGRVMRQPHAQRTGNESLDQCYVYCNNVEVRNCCHTSQEWLGIGRINWLRRRSNGG